MIPSKLKSDRVIPLHPSVQPSLGPVSLGVKAKVLWWPRGPTRLAPLPFLGVTTTSTCSSLSGRFAALWACSTCFYLRAFASTAASAWIAFSPLSIHGLLSHLFQVLAQNLPGLSTAALSHQSSLLSYLKHLLLSNIPYSLSVVCFVVAIVICLFFYLSRN